MPCDRPTVYYVELATKLVEVSRDVTRKEAIPIPSQAI